MAEEADPIEVEEEAPEIEAPETEEPKEDTADTPDVPDASDEYAQSLASRMGWVPKDQWRGDPDDWRPAQDFLEQTVEINRTIRRDLKATKDSAERAARAAAAIIERAVEDERRRLETLFDQAVEEGDGQAARKLRDRISGLHVPAGEMPSDGAEFAQRHSGWFNVDPIATQMALNVCQQYADKGADAQTQLAEAEKTIRRRFPEYFADPKPKPKGPAQVETSSTRSSGPSKRGPKGFADLPSEAKQAALDFEKRGRTTKEEYAKLYWQENA